MQAKCLCSERSLPFETRLGMGVVTVSSSGARSPFGLKTKFSTCRTPIKRSLIVAFKADKSNSSALVTPHEQIPLPIETPKEKKRIGKSNKHSKRVKAISTEVSPFSLDVDYNEAAAKLENIWKLSTVADPAVLEEPIGKTRRGRHTKRKTSGEDKKWGIGTSKTIVKNPAKKAKRLSLYQRVAMRNKEETSDWKRKEAKDEAQKISELLQDYSSSTNLVSLDWKKQFPPVLSSREHAWLFKLMQPMKALVQVKEDLQKTFGREPSEAELAEATNMNVFQLRKTLEVGHAARNKLIKHNLRLVLFVINKYFQDFASGPKFEDLCQAGVKGLITAIDRFEPKRRFQLSTYALFWIRHTIIRSITLSSFQRVPFGFESIRSEIQRAKLELLVKLGRSPTEEEIIEKVGITPERYNDVMRASIPVYSLNSRNAITQEELIDEITDVDEGDNHRRPALLRLALDDVLDSLKPKESLVIRQRYGLDGRGNRTLGEIAGNLNISREMVRKYEVKALMKLKHRARVDYLRRYVV